MAQPVSLPRIGDAQDDRSQEDRYQSNEDRLTEPTRARPALNHRRDGGAEEPGRRTAQESRQIAPPAPRPANRRPAPRRFSSTSKIDSEASSIDPAAVEEDTDAPASPPPHKVRLSSAKGVKPAKEVQAALDALSGMPLHIVYIGQGKDDPSRVVEDLNDRYDSSRAVYDFPSQVDAVVLLCYTSFMEIALAVVQRFKKLCYTPPVLPLLLRSDSGAFDFKDLNKVSAKLTKAGADDVLVQPRNKHDLPDMLQTVLALVDDHWEVERNLLEAIDERANALFFQTVDRIIQGFPKMNTNVAEIAPSRANLGGVGKHTFVNVIGSGKFGVVYKTRTGPQVDCEAVKVLQKRSIRTPKHANQVMKECRLLQKVTGHPKIAEFRGLVHARRNLYIFMEYVGSMDLLLLIRKGDHGRLDSCRVLELLLQILDAVAFCHTSLVAHRDIKSENVVLTSEAVPKLVDFGLAVPLSTNGDNTELCSDRCGTIPFAPPEVYRGLRFDPQAMDVWSIGILTLEMRCGNNSVCRMLGCVGMNEPTPELADVFERFFSVTDWPQMVQNANGFGMAQELLTIMRCCLVVRPDLRWRARDLWQHVANSCGADRVTRETRNSSQITGRGEASPVMQQSVQRLEHISASLGSDGILGDDSLMPADDFLTENLDFEEMPLDGDFSRGTRPCRTPGRQRANYRKLRTIESEKRIP